MNRAVMNAVHEVQLAWNAALNLSQRVDEPYEDAGLRAARDEVAGLIERIELRMLAESVVEPPESVVLDALDAAVREVSWLLKHHDDDTLLDARESVEHALALVERRSGFDHPLPTLVAETVAYLRGVLPLLGRT